MAALPSLAQLGGSRTYMFMQLPPSARVAALGSGMLPMVDDDVNLAMMNPGALNPQMSNQLAFNTALYFSNINFGYFGYARHSVKWNTTLAGGLQYISYGWMDRTDPNGTDLGRFKPGESALYLSASRQYRQFRYGATLKFITSSFEEYSSIGLAIDVGGTYVDSTGRFMAAVVVRHLGTQLTAYTPGNREPLPLDIQIGIMRQPEHLPFRLFLVFHNLQRPDIRYDDPSIQPDRTFFGIDTTDQREKTYLADRIARHIIIGGEMMLGTSLRLRIGYNHMRRQEMRIPTRSGMAGFSFGAGINISKFRVDYSLANYHVAGSSHQFSITTNLSSFIPSLE